MHEYETLHCDVRLARSRPKNTTKRFISLIVDVVDPPKLMGQHPVISPDLEKALSAIQKGAEERMEILKSKKKQGEKGESSFETVPKLIGHIEKMEEKEIEGDDAVAVEDVSGRQTADKDIVVATEDVG